MPYTIDQHGAAQLGPFTVPVPCTVSAEAQAFLRTSPWAEGAAPGEAMPAWELRGFVDEQMRALSDAAAHMYPVDIEEVSIDGVRCHLVKPKDMPPENQGKVLMNLHGGAFVLGSGALIEAIPIAHLAKVTVLAVDYRLAPEHPYPAAVDDVLTVYRQMLNYHAPAQIGIYGSSAGGFLTAQAIMRLKHEGLPLPSCCGVFTGGGSFEDFGDSAQIFTLLGFYGERIPAFDSPISEIKAYLGDHDRSDPLISAVRGDLSDFPPTLLVTGTRDALLSATAAFHLALRKAGRDADLIVFEAMPHAHWYMLQLPEAREALDLMARFFLKHLGTGG